MQQIILDDCRVFLDKLKDCCIDALATDSPYGLGFMNKSWDKEIPGPEYWTKVLRVLKPGAYGVAMGAPRLYHRLACAIEDSGFEIRDCIMWLYGSGFPKSHNVALGIDKHLGAVDKRGRAIPTASSYQACDVNKREQFIHKLKYGDSEWPHIKTGISDVELCKKIQEYDKVHKLTANKVEEYIAQTEEAIRYEGYGTALKPAYEPMLLIRKPLIGNVAENVLTYGVGGLNIEACRIGNEEVIINRFDDGMKPFGNGAGHEYSSGVSKGRWPANICHDGSDEVMELFPKEKTKEKRKNFNHGNSGIYEGGYKNSYNNNYLVGGSPARFFYCSKASRKEREAGLHERDPINVTDGRNKPTDNPYQRGKTQRLNTHPSVKPIALCRWLSRLICPPNGTLIDPFMGSGSFGCAAALEGFNWIGIDNDKESFDIAEKRIAYWQQQGNII